MSIKNKAIELANETKSKACTLSSDFKESGILEKAKITLSDTKEAVSKIDSTGFKLMNFFAVFSLSALLISTFFPITRIMGQSLPLSELTPSWLYVVTLVTLFSYLLGAKQMLSRGLIVFLIAAISFTVFSQLSDVLRYTGMPRGADVINILVEILGAGFYLFMISFVLLIIAGLKPGYSSNADFWSKIIKK